ncbi:hypothetical protein DFH08DRAFT_813899 [Mycena albidolilacea]|uniref:Uncharacterized protein n=1 Tax=Mycena albidolilacea TaxID=1033008 RepID=A0AAD7ELC6_9AGAR|nr:hypothetical protein DFH08DRAFT_813899 [Mycena albidolilacea]
MIIQAGFVFAHLAHTSSPRFLIIADGNPIDIKIMGSASVTFGGFIMLDIFHLISSDAGARPIQLSMNLINVSLVLSLIVNRLKMRPECLLRRQFRRTTVGFWQSIIRGKTICGPTEVESMGEKEGNAGVYQTAVAEGPKDVRGAVGYVLPGVNSSILVIYFDAVKCRLLFVDSGTVIDSNIVDKVEAEGKKKVSGSLVLEHGGRSNFVAEETPNIMPGNLVEMQVLLRNVMTAPVPPPPEKDEELMTHH